jgi:RhtB (resistance to homoserine/threonine) family protein
MNIIMELILAYKDQIISLTGLSIVALVSPGPDFAIIVRNSLIYSRKTAILTALGIALGIMVHVIYSILGLRFIIDKISLLIELFKYMGAGYLFYIGYKGISAKKHYANTISSIRSKDMTSIAAIRSGFLTNALNPKAMLFFLSLFSILVTPDTPMLIINIYASIIFITTFLWFSFVALCLSGKKMRERFIALSHWIERITGGLLIIIGIKLLFIKMG